MQCLASTAMNNHDFPPTKPNGEPQTKSLPAPILRGLFPKTIFYLKWFWADFPGPFQIEDGGKN